MEIEILWTIPFLPDWDNQPILRTVKNGDEYDILHLLKPFPTFMFSTMPGELTKLIQQNVRKTNCITGNVKVADLR